MAWQRRLTRPGFYIELVLPPALLCYFAWAWRICTGPLVGVLKVADYLANDLGYPSSALIYSHTGKALLVSITIVFLRLYFLPSRFALPPTDPQLEVTRLEVVFEVPRPRNGKARLIRLDDEDNGLIARCKKDLCTGRWKPARARHCSECGRCRVGFDHHCLFVANCISAPVMPSFLALILMTPPIVLFLSMPLLRPVLTGMKLAWEATGNNPRTQAYWNWGWSWVVPAGPLARFFIGLLLAWSDVDGPEGYGELWRVDVGLLLLIGNFLSLITAALAFWQVQHVLNGELGNDHLRERAYRKARVAVESARRRGEVDTKSLEAMERFSSEKWFFVPFDHEVYAGAVVPALPDERPYDLGRKDNFDLMIGRGRGWLRWMLPWNAARRGMSTAEASVWPLSPGVKLRLESEAERLLEEGLEDEVARAAVLEE